MAARADDQTLESFIAKASQACATVLWKQSIDQQQAYINALNKFRGHVPELEFARACKVIQTGLGIATERFQYVMQLTTTKDLRRALKFHFEPIPTHHRLPGEDIYPRDGWLGSYLL